jgi:hypothetical protein
MRALLLALALSRVMRTSSSSGTLPSISFRIHALPERPLPGEAPGRYRRQLPVKGRVPIIGTVSLVVVGTSFYLTRLPRQQRSRPVESPEQTICT